MTPPVWPQVPASAGHYESFYLRAADPASPRAVWLRHTVHKRPTLEPLGSIWLTVFDDGVTALKQTWDRPSAESGVHIEGSHFDHETARGSLDGAFWDLRISGDEPDLAHLPKGWMYGAPLPKTKSESPRPRATFDGHVTVAGERIDMAGWKGMCGHNWGTEHADTWIWLHSALFEGDPEAWIDLVIGRVRIGPVLTPWIANGACSIAGRRQRIGGLLKRVHVKADARGADISIPGEAEITVRSRDIVVWRYAAPDLSERHSAHSSNAELTLTTPGNRELFSAHGAAYELGLEPGGHGDLPVQPYPDGV